MIIMLSLCASGQAQTIDLNQPENRADIVIREALKLYPHDSEPMIAVYQQVGNGLITAGVIDSAIGFLRQAHDMSRQHQGDDHVNTALLSENVGLALFVNGQYLSAHDHFDQAAVALATLSGANDIDALLARSRRGEAALALQRPQDALVDFTTVANALQAQIGAESPGVLRLRLLEALAEIRSGQFPKAVDVAAQSWSRLNDVMPDSSSATYAQSAFVYARILYELGRYEEGLAIVTDELTKLTVKNFDAHPLRLEGTLLACRLQLRLDSDRREMCHVAYELNRDRKSENDASLQALSAVLRR